MINNNNNNNNNNKKYDKNNNNLNFVNEELVTKGTLI